jgi:hypothetical protein
VIKFVIRMVVGCRTRFRDLIDMPDVNGDQFRDYMFETSHDPDSNTTSAIASVYAGENSARGGRWFPAAMMRIDGSQRAKNRQEQELINSGHLEHGVGYDQYSKTGQMKWTGGVMNDATDKVSWLAMDKEGLSPRQQSNLLKGMFGTAVQTHGAIPHADKELTLEGSRISKAMNRRYGLKPHPDNPDMRRNVLGLPVDSSDFEDFKVSTPLRGGDWKEHTDNEVVEGVRFIEGQAAAVKESKSKKKKRNDPQLPGMED